MLANQPRRGNGWSAASDAPRPAGWRKSAPAAAIPDSQRRDAPLSRLCIAPLARISHVLHRILGNPVAFARVFRYNEGYCGGVSHGSRRTARFRRGEGASSARRCLGRRGLRGAAVPARGGARAALARADCRARRARPARRGVRRGHGFLPVAVRFAGRAPAHRARGRAGAGARAGRGRGDRRAARALRGAAAHPPRRRRGLDRAGTPSGRPGGDGVDAPAARRWSRRRRRHGGALR